MLNSLPAPHLGGRLSNAFPKASPEDVEDALQEARLIVFRRYGEAGVAIDRLLYVVAWRQLRGTHRRRVIKFDIAGQAAWQEPNQGAVISASRWIAIFERELQQLDGPHAMALQQALVDKMETGESDGCIAERCGIRRECLNIAWRRLLREILSE